MWRKFEAMRGQFSVRVVTSISVPDRDLSMPNQTNYWRIFDPKEMSQQIMQRNPKHFNQAEGSPPNQRTTRKHNPKQMDTAQLSGMLLHSYSTFAPNLAWF